LAFNMAGIIGAARLWLRFGWRLIIVWPTLVLFDFAACISLFSLLVVKEHKFWV
jgi:ABC-type multidrug transport system permease subunit